MVKNHRSQTSAVAAHLTAAAFVCDGPDLGSLTPRCHSAGIIGKTFLRRHRNLRGVNPIA
jgi:hypothetical protein